ncbi:MAG: TIGR00730 family Rossman fold protein [Clostridia bacterium]|nr:TIGR00730 family Rossman fold protein [Clostridia bacterium]
MKICVFGASSATIDRKYIEAVEDLGEKMAKKGHSLVFGAGATGLMGAAARGVKRGGGYIHGIIPEFFREEGVEIIYQECDELTYTGTMAERKFLMEQDADAFIVTPGGIGTFEEFYEVLTLKQLGQHNKAIVIFNIDRYYRELEDFMCRVEEKGFITPDCHKLYAYCSTPEEILDYLENYVPYTGDLKRLKPNT